RRRVLPRDIRRSWQSALDLVLNFSFLGLFLLVGATRSLAQTSDIRITDGARQETYSLKGTMRSIGGIDDTFYIGTLNGTIYWHAVGQVKKRDPIEIKNLRTELENMMEEDQRFRTRVEEVEQKYGQNSKELEALWKEQTDLDNRLLKRLEEII